MLADHDITAESRFLEPPRETKIGLRNREYEKSGLKLQCRKYKGNDHEFWFEISGVIEG